MLGIDLLMTDQIKVERILELMFNSMLLLLGKFWLHLKNKMATACIGIFRVENTGVGLEAVTSLVPSVVVERIKVVTPVELEHVVVLIIGEHLDVVVKNEPRHVNRVEAGTPRLKGRRPEVHA